MKDFFRSVHQEINGGLFESEGEIMNNKGCLLFFKHFQHEAVGKISNKTAISEGIT